MEIEKVSPPIAKLPRLPFDPCATSPSGGIQVDPCAASSLLWGPKAKRSVEKGSSAPSRGSAPSVQPCSAGQLDHSSNATFRRAVAAPVSIVRAVSIARSSPNSSGVSSAHVDTSVDSVETRTFISSIICCFVFEAAR